MLGPGQHLRSHCPPLATPPVLGSLLRACGTMTVRLQQVDTEGPQLTALAVMLYTMSLQAHTRCGRAPPETMGAAPFTEGIWV